MVPHYEKWFIERASIAIASLKRPAFCGKLIYQLFVIIWRFKQETMRSSDMYEKKHLTLDQSSQSPGLNMLCSISVALISPSLK